MKKRVLSLALALVIMVGMVPTASAANGYKSISQYAVGHYREAMAYYDLAMTDPSWPFVPENVFLDPHEAWDSYITNQRPNNWFHTWSKQHWAVSDTVFAREQRPNNWHTESPEWWARIDSYMEIVATKEHAVDTTITWSTFKDWTSAYYPYNTDNFSAEDLAWAEWHDITIDYAKMPSVAPFKGISYEDWTTMRNNMSDEEDALFNEWWYGHYGNHDGRWNGVIKDEDAISFEEYKERKGLSENQPVQPSMEPVPTVIPTATPAPTPSVVPTATPEPVPTPTPVPDETKPVQHFADVTPDAWYYEAVNNMAEAGILKGKGDGLFHPNDNITDAEIATILCRISQTASAEYEKTVIENPTHWAERAITACRYAAPDSMTQLFSTYVENADEPTKRHRVFFTMSFLALEDQFSQYWHPEFLWEGKPYYQKVLNVTDEDLENARQEIRDLDGDCYRTIECWALGIIHGDGNGYVHPQATITRAELCQILYNMGAKTCYLDL